MMRRRWELLGLLALTACSGMGDGASGLKHEECPNVVAGSLPEPVQAEAQRTSSPLEADDGREAVIIRYRQGNRVSAAAVRRTGARVTAQYHSVPAVAARVTPEERARLAADPDVERIEPDVELRALGLPPMASGYPDEYTEAVRQVQAPAVWDANQDGRLDPGAPVGAGIRACIIDSGIDPRHPELTIPFVDGYDFVDDDEDPSDRTGDVWGIGHGTHVAGIVAAQLGSGGATYPEMSTGGMVGVAPGVELLIARVLNVYERAQVSDVLSALEWCQQKGAHIVSLSLGTASPMGITAKEAFQAASDSGMLIIAASGNDSSPERAAPISYPAAFESVLSVGAVDSFETLAPFSNQGETLGLVAPGVDVLSTITLQGSTVSELDAEGSLYQSRSLFYAPAGDYTGELVDCGVGEPGGCRGGTCDGFVAYVRSAGIYSTSRMAQHVMRQGAKAIIFGVDESELQSWQYALEGPGRQWAPSLAVGRESRAAVLQHLGKPVRVNLRGVDYAYFPGTSMAAPHVTGAAALVWSARPSLTAAEVRTLLLRTAKDLGDTGPDAQYGSGLVQVKAALDALNAQP